MKKYVKFEVVEKEVLNDYLSKGWQILFYNEDEKNYEVGLPIEKAYEQIRTLVKKFVSAGLLENLFIHTCEKYGKNFKDYDYVNKNSIKQYNKNSNATHSIEWNDQLNSELNEIIYLFPFVGDKLFAKPIKKE